MAQEDEEGEVRVDSLDTTAVLTSEEYIGIAI